MKCNQLFVHFISMELIALCRFLSTRTSLRRSCSKMRLLISIFHQTARLAFDCLFRLGSSWSEIRQWTVQLFLTSLTRRWWMRSIPTRPPFPPLIGRPDEKQETRREKMKPNWSDVGTAICVWARGSFLMRGSVSIAGLRSRFDWFSTDASARDHTCSSKDRNVKKKRGRNALRRWIKSGWGWAGVGGGGRRGPRGRADGT